MLTEIALNAIVFGRNGACQDGLETLIYYA